MTAGAVDRFWALEGATLTLDKTSLMLNHPPGKVEVPCPSFLFQHRQGLALMDTGLYPGAAEDPSRVYGREFVEFMGLHYEPHQRIDRQLESLGFSFSDVKYVILSHAHFDHIGGIHLFPQATVIAGAGELQYALMPMSHHAGYFRREEVLAVARQRVHEVTRELDLFGDGSITILPSPGHTPGNLSVLVRTRTRPFLFSGDALHLRESLDTLLPLANDYSAVDAVRSIEHLRLLSSTNETALWIGHDMRDWIDFGGPGCFE